MRLIMYAVVMISLSFIIVGCEHGAQHQANNNRKNASSVQKVAANKNSEQKEENVARARVTTSQPLPQGWKYINKEELGYGPLAIRQ